MTHPNPSFMQRAIALSREGMLGGDGGPFGAVVVQGNRIVAEGHNQVLRSLDPTAHAEVVAIRHATQALKRFDLAGCVLYASCEPCPMCLAAAYWARLDAVYYANTRQDAASIGFDDAFFHQQLALPLAQQALPTAQLLQAEAHQVFQQWQTLESRQLY